jgi:hypothetical protein
VTLKIKKTISVYVVSAIPILGSLVCFIPNAQAGLMVVPSIKWATYSFEPVDDEITPNYFSYGLSLSAGFSIMQTADVAVFGNFFPGRLKSAMWMGREAEFVNYGVEIATRIEKTLYLAVRGGPSVFRLFSQRDANEVPEGSWDGTAIGISMGAIFPISRSHFMQFSIDMMQSKVKHDTLLEERTIDMFSISASYVFNDFQKFFKGNKLLKSFLRNF